MTAILEEPLLWAERTWEELPEDLARVAHAAILPVGATEQHGPHLGCGMDHVLADRLCADVSRATGVPMLPTLPYGCSLATPGDGRGRSRSPPRHDAARRSDRHMGATIPACAGCSS